MFLATPGQPDLPGAAGKMQKSHLDFLPVSPNTGSSCQRWKFAYPDPLANFQLVAQGGSRNDIYGVMRRPSNVSGHPGVNRIYLEQQEKCKNPTWISCQLPTLGAPANVGNSPTLIPWPIFNTIVAQGGSWIDFHGVMRRPSNVSGHPGVNRIYLEQQEKCKNPTWISCQLP
ncbi:hypothetical protein KR074_005409 [Drosophila pseudoananassae]|nr:hypothetical protein KR074_005409 [Drosophila pseudoananassae]